MDSARQNDGNRVSLLDKLESLLCPICYKPMSEPKALSCLHSFCMYCLFQIVRENTNIKCPLCRKTTMVIDGKVDKLPTNIPLKSIFEEIKSSDEKCDQCGLIKPHDLFYCGDCNILMCNACKVKHVNKIENKNHNIRSSKRRNRLSLRLKKFVCPEHEHERCRELCVSCDKPICKKCLENHKKQGHEIMNIIKFVFQLNERGPQLKSEINEIAKKSEEHRRKCLNNKALTDRHIDAVIAKIEEEYNTLEKKLEKDKLALIKPCLDLKEQNEQISQQLIEQLKDCIDSLHLTNSLIGNILLNPFEDIQSHDPIFKASKKKLNEEREKEMKFEKQFRNATKNARELGFDAKRDPPGNIIGQLKQFHWERKSVPLTHNANGMTCTAVDLESRTFVGYFRGGVEVISDSSTVETKRIFTEVSVIAIAIDKDGDFLLRSVGNEISVYHSNYERLDAKFVTKGHDEGGYGDIATDAKSNIYASYRKTMEIQVFKKAGGHAFHTISCKGCNPQQILVMPNLDLVIMDASVIRIMNEKGETKYELKRKGSLAYPALAKDGILYIAWVNHQECSVEIDKHTSGMESRLTFIAENNIDLSGRRWYNLQVVATNKLVFCTPQEVHFFTLRDRPFVS